MVLYDHDSNAILAKPLTARNKRELIEATRVLHAYLSDRGLTPQYQILDNGPFAVAMLLGKFFRTRADVIPGHVVKKPAVIAVVHDETKGLKAALWRYFMIYDLENMVWTLLEQ